MMNQISNMIIDQVQEALRDRSLVSNPHLCATYRSELSGEYSYLVGQLEDIKARKPLVWLEMRKEHKSDSSTNRAYEATEDGMNEVQLRGKLKRVEKLMQGLNSLIKIAEQEAFHVI